MSPSSHGAPAGRLALALIIGLALTATGAGPRHGARAPITLTVAGCWTNKDQDAAFTKVATGFNKAQSAIRVKVIEIGDASKVLTEVSAGNPPDVYFDCSVSDLGQWAANGYILNLDPYIQSHHFDLSTLTSGARALGTFQGHTYALPLLEDTFMLLYNKKLFRQAGLDPNKPPTTAEATRRRLRQADQEGRRRQHHPAWLQPHLPGRRLHRHLAARLRHHLRRLAGRFHADQDHGQLRGVRGRADLGDRVLHALRRHQRRSAAQQLWIDGRPLRERQDRHGDQR